MNADPRPKAKRTNGHKAVVVSDEAFALLKSLQSAANDEPMQIRFDLKDVVSAFVLEAMEAPNIRERSRRRALAVIQNICLSPLHKEF